MGPRRKTHGIQPRLCRIVKFQSTDNPCWSFQAAYEEILETSNIALTDSYGCTHDITFDYDVFELPDWVCPQNVDVEVKQVRIRGVGVAKHSMGVRADGGDGHV